MKTQNTTEKTGLHSRNPHRFRYDFDALTKAYPELQPFVTINEHQIQTIDFSNSEAVKALNKALLITYYDIQNWDIPTDYLCPQFREEQITFIT